MSDNATHGSGPRPDLQRSRVSGPVGEGPRPPSRPRLCRRASERRSSARRQRPRPPKRTHPWVARRHDPRPGPSDQHGDRSRLARSRPWTARPPPRSSSCSRTSSRAEHRREDYVPAVTPGERVSAAEIRRAFERVGVETRTRNDDNSRPRDRDRAHLQRDDPVGVSVTMGAPTGVKTTLDRSSGRMGGAAPGPAVVRADLHPSPWAELQGENRRPESKSTARVPSSRSYGTCSPTCSTSGLPRRTPGSRSRLTPRESSASSKPPVWAGMERSLVKASTLTCDQGHALFRSPPSTTMDSAVTYDARSLMRRGIRRRQRRLQAYRTGGEESSA